MLTKKMKVERKGKAYPSQPSASSSRFSYKDPDSVDSVLKLLPVTILALALSLPNQDREVLAYLIARSIFVTTAPDPSSLITQHPKNKCKTKKTASKNDKYCDQKVPSFQCGCFDCYTRFWYRWDSSPNRDFIHQVIEPFEEHLVQKIESSKKHSRSKKKGKVLMIVVCGPPPYDGGITTLIVKRLDCIFKLKTQILTVDGRSENRERRRKSGERKEEEAAEQSVLFLQFPARSPLDRAEILTAVSRHVALHSGRLDRRLVAWKLAVWTENGAVCLKLYAK